MRYKLVLSDTFLFNWDNIPGTDNFKLIELLYQHFNIEWVKTALINKIDNGNVINLSVANNYLYLRLNEKKSKVTLISDDGKTTELIAKIENDQLNIYEKTKDIGENVFFSNLPSDYEVYLLYYPGPNSNKELMDKLRDLGNITGKNLFVNIAKLNDPNYKKIVNTFEIKTFPTVILTAVDKFASLPIDHSTAYVKIDNKKLLGSPDLTAECIYKIYNLFIRGKYQRL